MKIWVVIVEDTDSLSDYLFFNKQDAIDDIKGNIRDHNHFDTDEPYCTQEELEEKQNKVIADIENFGWAKDEDVTYYLEHNEVIGNPSNEQ